MAVSMLCHEAVNNIVDLAKLLFVWCASRCRDLYNIAQVGEELLFDCFLQAFVTRVFTGLSSTRQRRGANQNFLAAGFLSISGDANFLFNRTHQLLIGLLLSGADGAPQFVFMSFTSN